MTDFIAEAQRVIRLEAHAIENLKNNIDEGFVQACQLILACEGRVVMLGIGKSSHVGAKIAATLASTGTPAFFIHAAEASHGDFGMVTEKDIIIAISNSGETRELLDVIPMIKHLGVKLIAICGHPDSSLGLAADVFLNASVAEEACPLGLAPTASTTAALVLGDALAVSLLKSRNFTPTDFARTHPGGRLGKRLLLSVRDLMHQGDNLPVIDEEAFLRDGLMAMSQKGFGMTMVLDAEGKVSGIFTDGDLRRVMDKKLDIHETKMKEIMVKGGKHISADALATEALALMEKYKITALIIIDTMKKPVGLIHMHDLLEAGVA